MSSGNRKNFKKILIQQTIKEYSRELAANIQKKKYKKIKFLDEQEQTNGVQRELSNNCLEINSKEN